MIRRLCLVLLSALIPIMVSACACPNGAAPAATASAEPVGGTAESHRQAAEALAEATRVAETMQSSIDTVVEIQIRTQPQLARFEDTLREFITRYLTWDAVKDDMLALYTDTFTEAELRTLTAFYGTEVGAKSISALPALMQKGAEIGMGAVQKNMPEFVNMIMKKQEELKAKDGDAPPADTP